MIGYLVAHELRLLRRNRAMHLLLGLFALALVSAAALSTLRINELAAEREAGAFADRQIWLNQGERNPHSAAHFSRYAFKPVPALAGFDPGALDTAGLAVWMEGHYQNPAQFRRVEELGRTLRLTQLSPAWVLQVFGSLLVVVSLFAAVAGEREDRTLRQVLASGTDARLFASGKLLGAAAMLALTVVPALAVTALMVSTMTKVSIAGDFWLRLTGLFVSYALYFLTIAAVTISVSAMSKTRWGALATLTILWVAAVVVAPLLAADLGRRLHPDPDGRSVHRRVVEASNAYFNDEAHRARLLETTLRRHGADRQENLPFRYDGYELQYGEVIAHPKFAAIYGEIDALHARQERVLDRLSYILPNVNLDRLSAGLAGTDRRHHQAFVADAEVHRRKIVKQLNDDLTYGAPPTAESYVAGRDLWAQVADFRGEVPSLADIGREYVTPFLLLLIQAMVATGLAAYSLAPGRLMRASQ